MGPSTSSSSKRRSISTRRSSSSSPRSSAAFARLPRGTGAQIRPEQRFEVVGSALDELDSALERVRDARGKLARIEVRLVAAYERALAELRQAERDAEPRSG
jgi:hypothetical protein